MLEYKTALELILSSAEVMPSEQVDLLQSLHRVLASDVHYDTDMPPYNKSAMDGFACRQADLKHELDLVETIPAGKKPQKAISPNQCSKIMTGAMIPEGADFVFKKEDAQFPSSNKVRCINVVTANHICYQGEDVRKGDKVLDKSTYLASRNLPLLAGAGVSRPSVYCQPEVVVFATGSELIEPAALPLPHQIRNTNSVQLMGRLTEMNFPAFYGGILPDEEEILRKRISEAFNTAQVVVLTGGVSVGDFDLIPEIFASLDFNILVRSISIKPGKPMLFARKGNKYGFGLSGNPVSSFVQFELFVKPFLFALTGHDFKAEVFKLPLGKEIIREKSDRVNFIPAYFSPLLEVIPAEFHGSAHIHSLGVANCLIEIKKDIEKLSKGALVDVRPI